MEQEKKFPTEIIDLPSKGLLYPKESPLSSGKIEMKYMTAKEEDILTNYPCKEVSFFKKNGEYMGIIKIVFNTPEDLAKTTEERIKIFEQRYLVEEYIFKPKVIKCNKCQTFGHIARLCRSTERCGKCTEKHDTKNCTVEPKDFMCCHCKGNHETGDKDCPIMKNKEEQIKNRQHNG